MTTFQSMQAKIDLAPDALQPDTVLNASVGATDISIVASPVEVVCSRYSSRGDESESVRLRAVTGNGVTPLSAFPKSASVCQEMPSVDTAQV